MECEDKSNEHDQTGQCQLQEVMFDHQEYNEAENLKESDELKALKVGKAQGIS